MNLKEPIVLISSGVMITCSSPMYRRRIELTRKWRIWVNLRELLVSYLVSNPTPHVAPTWLKKTGSNQSFQANPDRHKRDRQLRVNATTSRWRTKRAARFAALAIAAALLHGCRDANAPAALTCGA